MDFLVFRRTDSALLVVPAVFAPPPACRREGRLTLAATCDVALEAFSPPAVAALGTAGYAVVSGADIALLAGHLAPVCANPDA